LCIIRSRPNCKKKRWCCMCIISIVARVHLILTFLSIQSCELYDPTANQWTLILDQCLPLHSSCAPSVVFETAGADGRDGGGLHVALLGGHSFASDSDHSMLQVVHFTGDTKSPRVECTVSTCGFNTRRVQYCTLNVLKLPARYVHRFH